MDKTTKALDDAANAFVPDFADDETQFRIVAELREAAELINRLGKDAARDGD